MTPEQKKAALRAVGIGVLCGIALVVWKSVADGHLDLGMAKYALVVAVVAGGTDWVVQMLKLRGRDGLAKVVYVAVIMACFSATFWLRAKIDARALTLSDRAELVAEGEGDARRLRHPTLGFSIRHPGAGFALTRQGSTDPSAQFFNYSNGTTLFSVGIYKGTGETSASLRVFVDALGAQKVPLPSGGEASLQVTHLEAADGPPRLSAQGKLGPSHLDYRAHGIVVNGMSYAVLTSVISPAENALPGVLESFTP